jgi:hypothetical protein
VERRELRVEIVPERQRPAFWGDEGRAAASESSQIV